MPPSVTPPTREALDAWCRGFVASVYNAGYAHAANDNKPDAEFVVRLTAELSARFPVFPVAVVEAAKRHTRLCNTCLVKRKSDHTVCIMARHILAPPGIDEGRQTSEKWICDYCDMPLVAGQICPDCRLPARPLPGIPRGKAGE